VDVLLADEARERALVVDRDAVRIAVAGELLRIGAVVDERDLRRGEGDDLVLGSAAVRHVEVVEVAACRAHDEDPSRHAGSFPERKREGLMRGPSGAALQLRSLAGLQVRRYRTFGLARR